MDIVVIGSAFVKNEAPETRAKQVAAKKTKFVEKRRNRTDRRKSVRDGVVVSLSFKRDRRSGLDRRRTPSDSE